MMLDKNAYTIFLLTYQFADNGITALSAQEYTMLAQKIKKADFLGPESIINMSVDELVKELVIEPDFASRIRKLIDLGGTASFYLERYFNQGFMLITRTDQDYPLVFKQLLLDRTPPFVCYVGNIDLINNLNLACIASISDLKETTKYASEDKQTALVIVLDSVKAVNQINKLEQKWNRILIISSIGLSELITYPSIRNIIHNHNTLLISTNVLESHDANFHSHYLFLMALVLCKRSTLVLSKKHYKDIQAIEGILNRSFLKEHHIFTEAGSTIHSHNRIFNYSIKIPTLHDPQDNNELPKLVSSIYTVGHSNHEMGKFIELLKMQSIEILIDIRTSPKSSYSSQFNQDNLKNALKDANIEYLFKGRELGGMPKDKSVLNSEGKIIREEIELMDWYQKGIKEVIKLAQSGKLVAIMCSEEDPNHCHRGYIVGNTLINQGLIIKHIRGTGEIQVLGLLESPSDQMELFL